MRATKRLLLVEDEVFLLNELETMLKEEGFEVVTALDGRVAQQMIALGEFDAIVSDIRIPGSVDGLELLEYVKETKPLPVILMSGFAAISAEEKEKRARADGWLSKPFGREELLGVLKTSAGIEPPPPEINLDPEYNGIPVADFVTGRQIRYDLYVRISKERYVKVAHSGEGLSIDRLKLYRRKGIDYLYLKKADFADYVRFSLALNRGARGSPILDSGKRLALLKHTGEVILEQLYSDEIRPDAFQNARALVENTISFLSDEQETLDLLNALNSHSDTLYAHSVAISLYSVLIARELGWTAPSTLFKVSIGGLMADIGKKEINREVLLKSRAALTQQEVQLIETHPVRGMEILSRVPSIPTDVIQIAYQHHERDQGTGYPRAITKNRIFPLARVVTVADDLSSLILKGPDGPGMSPREALNRLQIGHGSSMDKVFLLALNKILSMKPDPDLLKERMRPASRTAA